MNLPSIPGLTPGGVGIWTMVLLMVASLFKMWPALRKIAADSDGSLRTDLLGRVRQLEVDRAADDIRHTQEMVAERQRCAQEIGELRQQIIGMQRQIMEFQIVIARSYPLDKDIPPEMQRILDRMIGKPKD